MTIDAAAAIVLTYVLVSAIVVFVFLFVVSRSHCSSVGGANAAAGSGEKTSPFAKCRETSEAALRPVSIWIVIEHAL